MKKILALIAFALAATLAHAEPVKLHLSSGEGQAILNALASLDGADRVVKDPQTGEDKGLRIAYDFGKEGVRIRMAIRANLLAIKQALEAYEVARVGYVKEVFGVESLTEAELASRPAALKVAFAAKASVLAAPTPVELTLFTEADVATFAAAGVPGTTSVILDPLVAKPAKK